MPAAPSVSLHATTPGSPYVATSPSTPQPDASVLFCDISGFTSYSGKTDPEDVTETMNACFQLMERIVLDHGGTVANYIGDCVMALFGVPGPLPNAPAEAVRAAVAIREATTELLAQRGLKGVLDVHLSVNTGPIAAPASATKRREYSSLGPAVDLASTLLDVATSGRIIVGAVTRDHTSDEFDYKGKTFKKAGGRITAYELVCEEGRGVGGRSFPAPLRTLMSFLRRR